MALPSAPAPFQKIWVIGLGTIGSSLAVLLARNGLRVTAVEADAAALTRGKARLREQAERTGLSGEELRSVLARIDCTRQLSLSWLPDLVIEALPERLPLKCDLLREAHTRCGENTVFVTTTAGLSVTEIAARSGRMSRTIGLAVAGPEPAIPQTGWEVVPTPVTDEEVVRTTVDFLAGLGRSAIVTKDHPGFVGNALVLGYLNDAAAMYERGYAGREDIDLAMTLGCGLPSGPLTQLDAIGLDVAVDSLTAIAERTRDRGYAPAPILSRMVEAGLLGRKSGRGFHTYAGADEPAIGTPVATPARPVRRIGVVGSGIMASGIAEVCARGGFATTLVARTGAKAGQALASVASSLDRSVARGRLSPAKAATAMDNLTGTGELDALSDCDLVIEAVAEDLCAKRTVFARLAGVSGPGTVLATTTSSLSVLACAGAATGRIDDVVGMHFFNPAPAMKLVEIVNTTVSAPDAVATAVAVAQKLGRIPVRCGDRTGFIVNALLFPYLNRAVKMLAERYLEPSDVDTAMTDGFGYPVGPLRLIDIIGVDLTVTILQQLADDTGEESLVPARQLTHLAAANCLGRKTGRGFHRYPPA